MKYYDPLKNYLTATDGHAHLERTVRVNGKIEESVMVRLMESLLRDAIQLMGGKGPILRAIELEHKMQSLQQRIAELEANK